jgi:hypothetical protein
MRVPEEEVGVFGKGRRSKGNNAKVTQNLRHDTWIPPPKPGGSVHVSVKRALTTIYVMLL